MNPTLYLVSEVLIILLFIASFICSGLAIKRGDYRKFYIIPILIFGSIFMYMEMRGSSLGASTEDYKQIGTFSITLGSNATISNEEIVFRNDKNTIIRLNFLDVLMTYPIDANLTGETFTIGEYKLRKPSLASKVLGATIYKLELETK